MMRSLFAASAAVLFGAGVPSAQAQCGCARPSAPTTTVSVRGVSPGIKSAVPAPVQYHVTAAAPTAGCAKCATATAGVAMPTMTTMPAPVMAPATAGCPHCAAGQAAAGHAIHAALDDKAGGDGKPAAKADKEVSLTGTMVCAKCGLKEPGFTKCTNAIQVKDGEKTITYFLDDKGNGEDYHEGLCGGGTKTGAKVTGTVSEKDGKRWVKATKVEEKK